MPLGPDRWLDVVRVETASFPHPWDPTTVRDVLHSRRCRALGAETGSGDLVGHALFAAVGGVCHLLDLAVVPAWRRQGVGRRLVEAVESEALAARAPFVFLEVREGNVGGRVFYERLGFEAIGRRPTYYPDTGEDALVLIKDLSLAGRTKD